MALFAQQGSPAKAAATPNTPGPMSIICTGPVVPSVVYHHHHMYYLSTPNNSAGSAPLSQPVPSNYLLPNLMNCLVESVVSGGQQASLGTMLPPRIAVNPLPMATSYTPTWILEPSAVKVNPSFLNQIDNCVALDRSKLNKDASPKSSCASSSCSATSSSYFASLSSHSSACLSPLSSPSNPSSPSASPTANLSLSETSNSPDSSVKTELESKQATSSKSAKHTAAVLSTPPGRTSSLTHSTLATPLLSGNAGAFLPGAYFGAATGSLLNQATGLISATLNNGTHTAHPQQQQQQQQSLQPVLSYRDYYARFGVYYTPVPWNQSYGMERVWMSEFRRIFSAFYNELWSIQPVERKPTGIKLHMFVDSAKVRFCCDRCGHSWTSMKGRIVFWFNLLPPNFNIGIVTIKLFGQKCESCKVELYEQPMWYPEEVTKVLMNLFNRVGQIFYGFEKTKFEKQRRMGKPRTPHNKYLCQACLEGICLSRRRSCTAVGAACSAEEEEEEEVPATIDQEGHEPADSSLSESETLLNKEQEGDLLEAPKPSERRIKVEDDDEGDYSEDSGIVESDADRVSHSEPVKSETAEDILSSAVNVE